MQLARALLRAQDVNVLVVDWVYGASFAYNLVVENYKEVAVQVSVLINQLQVTFIIYLNFFEFFGVDIILFWDTASIFIADTSK